MICVSLQNKTYGEIIDILSRPEVEMAEVRLDLCPLSDEELMDLFENSDTPLIATCRGNAGPLIRAVEAGARYADLELEAPADVSRRVQKLCRNNGTQLIRSYHNFEQTPSDEVLQMALARCFRYGADIAKVAVKADSEDDIRRIESLYSIVLEGVDSLEGRLIAFGMGESARESRLECLRRGAPFTYVALSREEATAPGQWTLEKMSEALYGSFKPYRERISGLPASKSFAQRAILCAALAKGRSVLDGYSPCGDSEAAIRVAEAIGAKVSREGSTLTIEGSGATAASLSLETLGVGESGLLARMMIPLMSVLNGRPVTITGEKTLLRRPLTGAVNKMAAFGVMLHNASDSVKREIHVPVVVKGPLIPGTADVSGADGSQLISGLMMALPLCGKPSTVYVGEPKSIPYMFITQDVLRRFGIKVATEMEGDAELLEQQDWSCCCGMTFSIPGRQSYKGADFRIEADWSAAANFLVAGAIFGGAELEGLDTSSVQADISIMDILVDAGAVVSELEDGTVCVRKAPLQGFETDLSHAPDLFPIVAVLAAFSTGVSRITGVGRLAGKESNRAEAILEMLGGFGVEASIEGDELMAVGESLSARLLSGRLLRGGEFSAHGDHRLVMALSVASLGADSKVVIDSSDCVSKSFPGFLELFGRQD